MLNKRKISREILGLTGISFVISAFFYGFIRTMANSVVLSYCDNMAIVLSESQEWEIGNLIKNVSGVAAVIIFVVLFLFLVGEKIENAVHELQMKEKSLYEERENLYRSLSHDIRTPLTTILSYSEYMKEKIEEESMYEYITRVQRKAEQIKNLTDQLLDGGVRNLEKIENGKFLMQQLADEWETALENNFQCEIDMNNCPDFAGEFDVREMRRIFDNLVSNVEKYADESKGVRLGISEKEECLVIKQENMIKKELQNVESRGIGITSIKRIVENYGGEVLVNKEDDRFTIEIIFRIL